MIAPGRAVSGPSSFDMETVIMDRTRVFIASSFLGLCLGAVYDIISFVPERTGKFVLRALSDTVYCLIFLMSFFCFVMIRANGEIRWYMPGGVILGLALYFCGFSDCVKKLLMFLGRVLKKLASPLKKAFVEIAKFFEAPWGQ